MFPHVFGGDQPQRATSNVNALHADSRDLFDPQRATLVPKLANLKQLCPRTGPRRHVVSIRGRVVSRMQQPNSDTLQVPDSHGVQCCLDLDRPCRFRWGLLGVTATFLPFRPLRML